MNTPNFLKKAHRPALSSRPRPTRFFTPPDLASDLGFHAPLQLRPEWSAPVANPGDRALPAEVPPSRANPRRTVLNPLGQTPPLTRLTVSLPSTTNPSITMKYIATVPVSVALVGAAVVSSGYSLDAASVFSILFVSCLPAWVLWDYDGQAQSRKTPRRAPVAQPKPQAEPAVGECVSSPLATAFGK